MTESLAPTRTQQTCIQIMYLSHVFKYLLTAITSGFAISTILAARVDFVYFVKRLLFVTTKIYN